MTAAATISDAEPLKVGVLFSSTGVTAAVERTQLSATLLAIEEINEKGGIRNRPIVPIVYDPQSNPKQFGVHAERLLETDGVRIIFGCYMSSARKAVLPLVEARDGLLVYPTFYEGFEFSPNCLYTGAVPNQNSLPLARYMLENFGSRILLVGSNYVFPYESNRIFSDLIVEARGNVIDEIYVPLSPQPGDFDRTIRQIDKHRPDAVFSTVVGSGTAMLYEAYRAAGFDATLNPIASLTTSEAEVAEMSAEAAEGHLTAAPYFELLGNPVNTAFVARYKRRFGEESVLTAAAEAAYYQVHLVAAAVTAACAHDRRSIIKALRDIEFEAPQGAVRIDPENHHIYLWPRVARLDSQKRFQIVWDARARTKPDPYFVSVAHDEWSLGARSARAL